MRFSLIVATKGRTTELGEFLEPLNRQGRVDFEIIIVDQNEDDRLAPIIAASPHPVIWLRSTIANSSHARNLGIAASKGEIIAFPDDDCLYPENLLEKIERHFLADPFLGLLTGPSRGFDGELGSGRWAQHSCIPNYRNIWTCVIEFNMFFRRNALPPFLRFDEELGVGARFGSGEGVDLAITFMRNGAKLFYDFDLFVIHPDKSLTRVAVQRAYRYGTGFGRVLRKHSTVIPTGTTVRYLIRPLGGMLVATISLRRMHRNYYWQTFKGRLHGMLAKPPAAAAIAATPAQTDCLAPSPTDATAPRQA